MSTPLRKSIAGNYAGSFAVAIRNAIDPEDPSAAHYAQQMSERLASTLEYADTHGVSRDEVAEMIANAVAREMELLFGGLLTAIRNDVKRKNKG